MKPRKHYAIAALASLALAVTLGACSTGAEQKTVTVTAHSRVTVVPDVARITVSVVTEGKDAVSAQKANGKPTTAVIEALKGLGVAAEDIQTTYADLSPIWNDEGETSRYEMRAMLSVDGLPIESVSQAMEACVDAGASEVSGIEYYASTYDEAYEEALGAAVEAARPKAEAIATAGGVSLGPIVSVTEGYQDMSLAVTQETPLASVEEKATADGGLASVEPGQVTVEAEATVSYALH